MSYRHTEQQRTLDTSTSSQQQQQQQQQRRAHTASSSIKKRKPIALQLIATDAEELDYEDDVDVAATFEASASTNAAAASLSKLEQRRHRRQNNNYNKKRAPKMLPKNTSNASFDMKNGAELSRSSDEDDFKPLQEREPEEFEPSFAANAVIVDDDDDDDDDDDSGDGDAEAANGESVRFKFSWKKLWQFTGPGWLMSIAFLDPGNLESDLQAGAIGGYSLLWVLLLATIIGLICQVLAARLGVVTGLHLAEICREEYPRPVTYMLWIMTELAIIGADIQEVIGSAIALNLLSFGRIPYAWGVVITALDTFIFLFLENYGIRKLEAFFAFLIGIMVISFGVEYVISQPNQWEVLKGCVYPRLSSNTVLPAIGLVGSVIMPHNLYLHSALVQSRQINRHKTHKIHEANVYNTIESSMALSVSFLINLFVVSVFAAAFHALPPNQKDDIGLINAGDRLEQRFATPGSPWGTVVRLVWAVGLLAAGQSSTMTGTYAGQFVMAGFLNLKIPMALRVTITRGAAILPAVLVAVYATEDLDPVNEFINVLQAIQLPFALLPLLKFTSSEKVMGVFSNKKSFSIFIWTIGILMIGANVYIVAVSMPKTDFAYAAFGVIGCLYAFCIFYLAFWDMIAPSVREKFETKSNEKQRLIN